ncbi:MAG: ABC transporter permease [Parasporobacterium sp.]|nr:ABC transporter permease [Parasporobacterium sp.]
MKKQRNTTYNFIPILVIIAIIAIWQIVSVSGLVPSYILPSPLKVFKAFVDNFPLMADHGKVTLIETAIGLAIGIFLGFVSAAVMDASRRIRKAIYPLLIISQTIPTVAIAPLLILWFSYGLLPKIILVVITSFFPIAVGLLDGFMSVDEDQIMLLKSMKANKWQIFWNVKFPGALTQFFSGLKIAVSYAVVSAVVSEWLGGTQGLGVYMTRVKKSYSYDKMFAVIILISLLSLALIAIVNLIQYKSMPWKRVKK